MKTVLFTGEEPVPPALRELVQQGSTSFAERRAADAGEPPSLDVDRVVFWSAAGESSVGLLAAKYARTESAERREIIVFVTGEPSAAVPELPANEVYVWPRDEDRLKMAFLTGA